MVNLQWRNQFGRTEFSYSTGGVLRLLGSDHNDQIGESFAWIPDIDSDGLVEIAIGSYGDDENGSETELFMYCIPAICRCEGNSSSKNWPM